MGAVLAPWPFLDGGATAVLVATIFDGATVEEELLWRGGARVAARPGGGDVEVRLGACGFELVLPRACDGEVAVGARMVDLRELSLCGVTVLPLGPRTRVTVRVGLLTLRVEATTPPKRLPLAPPASWRQRAGVAVAALAGALFAFVLHATAPRTPSWTLSDHVLMRVSLLTPALHGGRAPSATAATSAAHATVTPAAEAAATSRARARQAAQTQRTQQTQTQMQQTQTQMQTQMQTQQTTQEQQTQEQQRAQTQEQQRAQTQQQQQQQAEQQRARLASLAAEPARRAVTDDDARRAAAIQARAAGIIGALAHSRAAFLGDEHVAAADFTDTGSFAVGAGDASSAAGASGAANGSSGGSSGSASGLDVGTLSGDDVGEAYGNGGLGLSGTGLGGGGAGDGTIGLGTVGTIGCGCGEGSGVGYGGGVGGLGGRRASVPDVVPGTAEVRGGCDKDLIRRVVHAHLNELRFCYERVLQSRPELAGRVASRFVIGFDGRVTASAIASSALTPAVDACVAQAIARWQFAPRCVGEVSYPFLFEPVSNAP